MFNRKKATKTTQNIPAKRPVNFHGNVSYITPSGSVYKPFDVLAKEPHLLIAGCTGSGKSVTLNGIITTLITVNSPARCQFVLVDPKRVELVQYAGLPHVIRYATEQADIIDSMKQLISIMEYRYSIMQRNRQKDYNGSDIYLIIDELADIMTTNKKEFLPLLQRLAQLGRAAHIHTIICTQSVYVSILPGVIRCNYPVIVGLRTATAQQSRLLISATGCEQLPDPKTTGKGFAMIRDGSDLYNVMIYKYPDSVTNNLIRYWTSRKCIA